MRSYVCALGAAGPACAWNRARQEVALEQPRAKSSPRETHQSSTFSAATRSKHLSADASLPLPLRACCRPSRTRSTSRHPPHRLTARSTSTPSQVRLSVAAEIGGCTRCSRERSPSIGGVALTAVVPTTCRPRLPLPLGAQRGVRGARAPHDDDGQAHRVRPHVRRVPRLRRMAGEREGTHTALPSPGSDPPASPPAGPLPSRCVTLH